MSDGPVKKKRHVVRKVLLLFAAIVLLFAVFVIVSMNRQANDSRSTGKPVKTAEETAAEIEASSRKAVESALADAKEKTEKFKLEDITEGRKLMLVYDSSRLDDVLGYPKSDVSYDTIRTTIKNNPDISDKFKDLYVKLASDLEKQYPDMELRIWYENLKGMKILEVDEMTMKVKAISASAYACYRKDENIIYTVKDYDYVPGTWEYQVIIHEMCHPIRSSFLKLGEAEVRYAFEDREGDWTIVDEAMNSILSLRSYDTDERDIAYQLQSNMVELMIDSMDNYDMSDYVAHNITYFEKTLNDLNGSDSAIEMLALLNLQYKDYHDDTISIDQSVFYPLYDYIARMYYSSNIGPEMSYQDALAVRDEFIYRISFDVPVEYALDTDHMKEFFEEHLQSPAG